MPMDGTQKCSHLSIGQDTRRSRNGWIKGKAVKMNIPWLAPWPAVATATVNHCQDRKVFVHISLNVKHGEKYIGPPKKSSVVEYLIAIHWALQNTNRTTFGAMLQNHSSIGSFAAVSTQRVQHHGGVWQSPVTWGYTIYARSVSYQQAPAW